MFRNQKSHTPSFYQRLRGPLTNRFSSFRNLFSKVSHTCTFVFLVQSLVTMPSYSQWQEQQSGTGATLWDVCFVDSIYGWAVGDSGLVIATTNGGENWSRQLRFSDSVELKQVEFLDRVNGFVAGNTITRYSTYEARRALLLRTTDGGESWRQRDSTFDESLTFCDMKWIDPTYGWIGLNNIGQVSWSDRRGSLFVTTDAGQSWSAREEIAGFLVGAVSFTENLTGFSFWSLSVDNFDDTHVHRITDGDTNWTAIGVIRQEIVKKAFCLSPSIVWTIGFGSARSIDAGESWTEWNWFNSVHAGEMRFIPCDLEVHDSNEVWLVGAGFYDDPAHQHGVLLKTTNSGEAWYPDFEVQDCFFTGISALSSREAWIVGSRGLIFRLRDTVTSVDEENSVDDFFSLDVGEVFPTPLSLCHDKEGATIQYFLHVPQHIDVTVHDILGREVKAITSELMDVGLHEVTWEGKGASGTMMSSGVYFFRVQLRNSVIHRKILLIH